MDFSVIQNHYAFLGFDYKQAARNFTNSFNSDKLNLLKIFDNNNIFKKNNLKLVSLNNKLKFFKQ